MTINWNDVAWKSKVNLQAYIRKYGNPPKNMSKMTIEELRIFAQKTEKGRALLDIEDELCNQCNQNLENCECIKCRVCINIIPECECETPTLPKEDIIIPDPIPEPPKPQTPPKKQIKVVKKKKIIIRKKSGRTKDDVDVDIIITKNKIKLKLFITEKAQKYKEIQQDVLDLLIYVTEKYNVVLEDNEKTTLPNIMKKVFTFDKKIQSKILSEVVKHLS